MVTRSMVKSRNLDTFRFYISCLHTICDFVLRKQNLFDSYNLVTHFITMFDGQILCTFIETHNLRNY